MKFDSKTCRVDQGVGGGGGGGGIEDWVASHPPLVQPTKKENSCVHEKMEIRGFQKYM